MNDAGKRQMALVMIIALGLLVCWIGWQAHRADVELGSRVATVAKAHNQLVALSSGGEEIVLPEDGGTIFVSVFAHDDWRKRPEEARVLRWFAKVPSLVRIRLGTIWHLYTPEDHTFQQSYSNVVLPTVMVQEFDGKVLYKSTGENIPDTAVSLACDLGAVVGEPRLFKKRPWLRLRPWLRPRPAPKPGPEPEPDDEEVDEDPDGMPDLATIPDVGLDEDGGAGFWLLLIVVIVCVAVAATVFNFRREAGL